MSASPRPCTARGPTASISVESFIVAANVS
jgi:hypothetical protein